MGLKVTSTRGSGATVNHMDMESLCGLMDDCTMANIMEDNEKGKGMFRRYLSPLLLIYSFCSPTFGANDRCSLMTWPYGAKYEGDYKNDKRNGE